MRGGREAGAGGARVYVLATTDVAAAATAAATAGRLLGRQQGGMLGGGEAGGAVGRHRQVRVLVVVRRVERFAFTSTENRGIMSYQGKVSLSAFHTQSQGGIPRASCNSKSGVR